MTKLFKRTVGYSPYGHTEGDLGPFDKLFTNKKSIRYDFQDIDCLLLWGGTDIHPSFYNREPHKQNGAPVVPSIRDIHEWKAMLYCKANNIPMIGVCRGAQFICAFAGGTLAQHVWGHHYDHKVKTNDGREIWVTSTHHQMMNPFSVPHELLAVSYPGRSDIYYGETDQNIPEMEEHDEPEIVYFPGVRGLAIQGHPEYGTASPEFQDYCVELANKYLFKEVS